MMMIIIDHNLFFTMSSLINIDLKFDLAGFYDGLLCDGNFLPFLCLRMAHLRNQY